MLIIAESSVLQVTYKQVGPRSFNSCQQEKIKQEIVNLVNEQE